LCNKQSPASAKEIAQGVDYAKRKTKARFYADENFPAHATEILREAGLDVLTVQEAGVRRRPDENQAAFALRKGRVLLTYGRDYLDERRFPLIHCPAIVVFDFGLGSTRHIKMAFRCL
jgi:predicted nuclease of predicted toxin-antitoxin system